MLLQELNTIVSIRLLIANIILKDKKSLRNCYIYIFKLTKLQNNIKINLDKRISLSSSINLQTISKTRNNIVKYYIVFCINCINCIYLIYKLYLYFKS